jgi:hypothetical protein
MGGEDAAVGDAAVGDAGASFEDAAVGDGGASFEDAGMILEDAGAAPFAAVADAYATQEDVELTIAAPGVLANDLGSDLAAVAAAALATSAGGQVSLAADGSFVYLPPADFAGTDSFDYAIVAPGDPAEASATVTIDVAPVNDPPIALADAATGDEGTSCLTLDPLGNDTDPDGDVLQGRVVAAPVHGHLYRVDTNEAVDAGDAFAGALCYKPNQRFFHGTDGLTYTAEDGHGGASEAATVAITIIDIS